MNWATLILVPDAVFKTVAVIVIVWAMGYRYRRGRWPWA